LIAILCITLHDKQRTELVQIAYRVPRWMKDKIVEVQRQNHMVTETEAVRHVVIKGLEALGVDLPSVDGNTA